MEIIFQLFLIFLSLGREPSPRLHIVVLSISRSLQKICYFGVYYENVTIFFQTTCKPVGEPSSMCAVLLHCKTPSREVPALAEGYFSLPFRRMVLYLSSKPYTMKCYEMFSKAGDKACDTLVNNLQKRILSSARVSADEIARAINEGMMQIRSKHPEVDDTEPRGHICHETSKALKDAGYGFFIDSYVNPCEGIYPYYR